MTNKVYPTREPFVSLAQLVSKPLNFSLEIGVRMQRHVADRQGLPSLFGLTSLGVLASKPLKSLLKT